MTVIFRGGPCDGESHAVDPGAWAIMPKSFRVLRHEGKCPDARYRWCGEVDGGGRHVFEHWPPRAGDPRIEESRTDAG